MLSTKLQKDLMDAYLAVHEEKRGHAAGASDTEKQASQLASDVRYKAKGKVPEGATEEEKRKIFLQILNASPAPNVVKSMAKEKLLGEEVEQLDELSKETLDSYITKASKDINKPGKKSYGKGNKVDRHKSVLKAVQKRDRKELRGEEVVIEKRMPFSPKPKKAPVKLGLKTAAKKLTDLDTKVQNLDKDKIKTGVKNVVFGKTGRGAAVRALAGGTAAYLMGRENEAGANVSRNLEIGALKKSGFVPKTEIKPLSSRAVKYEEVVHEMRFDDGKEGKEKRKEALRKKRGMTKAQMDKHPQFKDDDVKEGKMPEGLKKYLEKKQGKKEGKKDVKEGNQRDPESSKKDRTYSKQPDPSKDGFTGIGNMNIKDIMKMNAKMKKDKKDMKEGLGTVAGGAYGYKTGGVKGAIVGGTAGAVLDKMSKKKKPEVKEDKEQVNEILGMAAGALGAKMVGGAAAKTAAKTAMKAGLKSGMTSQAARTAAMKAGQSAGMKAGTSAAINYGTAGSIAGSVLGGVKNTVTTPVTKKPSGTLSADVDLFDIVKGKLLDEGLTEEESLDVMLTLTLEEINEALQLDEISAGLMMAASKAAEVARGKAAVAGNKALAMKKLGQGEKFYKGAVAKRKAAGQMGAGYKEGM